MMTHRQKKLSFILILLVALGSVIALVLYALQNNIDLYLTPTQIKDKPPSSATHFRVGGMVVKHSVHYGKITSFVLTDMKNTLIVHYRGILPDLFREGQGIVAGGHMRYSEKPGKTCFIADEVLAKHDENYMPPPLQQSENQS